jgi:hypothetical protein
MKTKRYPIRLLFGIGNNFVQGFSVVYEKEDGSAGETNVWFEHERFSKVKFTDSNISEIVFVEVEKKEEGLFFSKMTTEMEIDEIILSRTFQNTLGG